jgi:hypothetical protein
MSEVISINLLQALVQMSPYVPARIAAMSGLDRPSLLAALAGRRSLSRLKVPKLLRALGLLHGVLDPGIVHVWVVGVDISPLQLAIEQLFPEGAVLVALLREDWRGVDVHRPYDEGLFVLSSGSVQVLVKRMGLGLELPIAPPVNPEVLKGVIWRGGSLGGESFVTLPKEVFDKWLCADRVDMDEFSHVLRIKKPVDWEQLTTYATSCGLTAEKLMQVVETIASLGRDNR